MRIAFVTAYPPSPLRVRAYSFVRELARHHTVTVVTLCHSDQDVDAAYALRRFGVQVVAVKEPSWAAGARAASALPAGASLQVAHGGSAALRRELNSLVETRQVDLVHVEHLRAVAAVRDVEIPVVWDAVDCISHLYALGAQYRATPMLRVLGRLEARRARNEEQRLLSRLPHIVVTSSHERAALMGVGVHTSAHDDTCDRRQPDVRSTLPGQAVIYVVPNGVDLDYFSPLATPREGNVVVFSGRMSFHANVAAASILTREIMPLVWERRPDVRLVLAGSSPPRSVRRLARDRRVSVTGYVADLRPYIGGATVAVSPTPYAVGMQNKVLEALALSTPVVAMPPSVAGLRTAAGRDLLVADTPRDVADAILRLLDNAHFRARLGQNGRQYVVQHHDWRVATQALLRVYKHALDRSCQVQPLSTVQRLQLIEL